MNFLLMGSVICLQGADGILVPGGFGHRGVEGKILAAKYARENRVPYLGICLGMQLAVIEFARTVLGLPDAHSTELDPNTKNPCVIFMPEVCSLPHFLFEFQLLHSLFNSGFVKFLFEAGVENTYGRHYEVRLKKNLFSC